jgi:putative hemolysin
VRRAARGFLAQRLAEALDERMRAEELEALTVNDAAPLQSIPESGAVVLLADLPIGSPTGRALWRLVRGRRPDCLLLAPDPRGGGGQWVVGRPGRTPRLTWRNDPTRVARRWAAAGGAVLVLPAPFGFDPIPPELVRLLRLGAGPLVPLGMTLSRGRVARVSAGRPLPAARLAGLAESDDLAAYLELRLHALGVARRGEARRLRQERLQKLTRLQRFANVTRSAMRPIAAPVDSHLLAAELAELPHGALLASQGALDAYVLRQVDAPLVLREIGRLRETTFRAVGEGTGKPLDIDRFDATYRHLVVWNREQNEIVGAYRMIGTDEVLDREGLDGLYTHTLFRYDENTLRELGPALELGRSFVREEYQRSFGPLLLLWRAIGAYNVANPRYRFLFGAVSITAEYQPLSQALMVQYLRSNSLHAELSSSISSRRPVAPRTSARGERWTRGLAGRDLRDLSDVIAEIERDERGVPTLLKEYLKLGGRVLDFNVDPDFNDVLDALIVVDVAEAEPRVLGRYFTHEGVASLRSYHGTGSRVMESGCTEFDSGIRTGTD